MVGELSSEYCFLWIDWWASCLTKSEWAAWTQAVGSILALAVASAIAVWQVIARRRDSKQRARELFKAKVEILQLTADALGLYVSALRSADGPHLKYLASWYSPLQIIIEEAKAIQLRDMPTRTAVLCLVRIQQSMTGVIKVMDEFGVSYLGVDDVATLANAEIDIRDAIVAMAREVDFVAG